MSTSSPHPPEFIAEMKQQLLTEKAALEQELAAISTRRHGDYQSNFPDYGRNDEENATEVADYEATHSTTETLEERLKNIVAALARIEAGTYGVTAAGEVIPPERLQHTRQHWLGEICPRGGHE
jgi:RNA polymerase-binding transcription factor DksA